MTPALHARLTEAIAGDLLEQTGQPASNRQAAVDVMGFLLDRIEAHGCEVREKTGAMRLHPARGLRLVEGESA